MILSFEQVKSVSCGVAEIIEAEHGFEFRRFTKEQTEAYKIYRDESYAKKSMTNAGVRIAFETDSKSFSFTYGHYTDYSAGYGWFEIFANGSKVGNFGMDFGRKNLLAEVSLGDGIKCVEVYFPWQKYVTVRDLTLDDGSFVKPVKRSRTMLAYGDSITHGMSVQCPSRSYPIKLAQKIDADCINLGVSGDRFFPELLEYDQIAAPDIITVAYGTNDWWVHSRQTVMRRSREFIAKLSGKFPNAKIFVISPIYRANNELGQKFDGYLPEMHNILSENVKGIENVILIDGWGLVPADPCYYTDGLHPNDFGNDFYAENLYSEIKKYL